MRSGAGRSRRDDCPQIPPVPQPGLPEPGNRDRRPLVVSNLSFERVERYREIEEPWAAAGGRLSSFGIGSPAEWVIRRATGLSYQAGRLACS